MKKLLLLAAMASLACGASAQEEATLYNFNDAVFIIEGYETPVCAVYLIMCQTMANMPLAWTI